MKNNPLVFLLHSPLRLIWLVTNLAWPCVATAFGSLTDGNLLL